MRLRIASAIVVTALAAAACGDATGASAPPPGAPAAASPVASDAAALNAAAALLLPRDRFALPEFDPGAMRTLLGQLRGTPVVVNIWASWCGPCEAEAPDLAAAAGRFGHRVQFLGVDILDEREAAREFIRRHGWRYPSVFDPDGSIRSAFGIVGQPATLFFDRTGHQVTISVGGATYRAWQGPISLQALREIIGQLLR